MSGKVIYVALQQFCEQDDRPRRVLEDAGLTVRLNTLGHRLQPEEMVTQLREADAVLAGVESYDAALLAQLPRLRCISRCGIGTDAIDLAAARQREVAVLTTVDEVVEPVAQMAVAMILALARNLPLHVADARASQWRKHTGHLLSEWTVGLIGFGNIGQQVARYLLPFCPRILVCDPRPPALATVPRGVPSKPVPTGVTRCELPQLLAEADLVSIHAARDASAGPLLGERELALMKPGARLVNTARGYLVDEAALLAALTSGHLSAAALDVYEREPYTGPLMQLPQVLCTPHVATLTVASRAAMELVAARHIVDFFAAQRQPVRTPELAR